MNMIAQKVPQPTETVRLGLYTFPLEEELEVVDGLNVCVGIPPVCGVFLVDQDPGVMVTVDFSIEKVM
jgi:hypothetical protein